MKVLFAFYPLYVKYNHGIALLSALCKERGIDTALCVLEDLSQFTGAARDADWLGFSCVTEHDYKKSLPFMQIARQMGKKILLGGVYARRANLDFPGVKVCLNEGETLPDFLLHGDERLFREMYIHENLNKLPLPDYELFKNIPFERGIPFLQGKKVLPYFSSRGCPYKCRFCEASGQAGTCRYRTKVKEDLSYLEREYAPDLFFIGDELLPYYYPLWRQSWSDYNHPFVAYIRADIHPDRLYWLAERGMTGCAFGVESGDEEYRNKVLGKSLSDADIFRTVGLLNQLNIQYATFFMTDMPSETFTLKAKTAKMARELGGFPFIWKYEELFGGERWAQQQ